MNIDTLKKIPSGLSACVSGWMVFWQKKNQKNVCVSWRPFRGLSLGACSTPAQQSSGTVSGYLASPHPDSCGTVILDHTPKPNENSHLGESFIRVHTRSVLSAAMTSCPVCRETARPLWYLSVLRRGRGGGVFFHHPRQRRSHLGQPPRSPR